MKNKVASMVLAGSMIGVTGFLGGCKAPQPDKEVYIPAEYQPLMQSADGISFAKVWGKPEEIRKYDKIMVEVKYAPNQLNSSWWAKQNVRYLYSSEQHDLFVLTDYATDSFRKAFGKSDEMRLADKAGEKTLLLEFVIVQVVPNKPILGAVSTLGSVSRVGLMLLPGKLGVKGVGSDSGGAIAMECVLRDSVSKQVLAVFSDREKGTVALLNTNDFTTLGTIHRIIDFWAAQTVRGLDQIRRGEKVHLESKPNFAPVEF